MSGALRVNAMTGAARLQQVQQLARDVQGAGKATPPRGSVLYFGAYDPANLTALGRGRHAAGALTRLHAPPYRESRHP